MLLLGVAHVSASWKEMLVYKVKPNKRKGESAFRVVQEGWIRDKTICHTDDRDYANSICERLNQGLPLKPVSQKSINGDGSHRKKYLICLPQLRSSVLGSTQEIQ